MKALLDENVSLAVAGALRAQGWDAVHIAETADRAIPDEEVWERARRFGALLITRDHHLINPIRFPPEQVGGVLFLRRGNLTAAQEVALVVGFLDACDPATLRGHVVTLSPTHRSIR